MLSDEIERRISTLSKYDLIVTQFITGFSKNQELPQIQFDRTSYPGVEAHLFTIADAASWQPELTQSHDVILSAPRDGLPSNDSWTRLITAAQDILDSLEHYRQGLKHGIIPSSHWIYNEIKWYRKNWNGPPHEMRSSESFLYLVDESIRQHIRELNDLGFQTTQSCSGLAKDHTDRKAHLPYVMFDERMYPRSSAHLFTIADITGWIPCYGPHQFDIEFRLPNADGAEGFWDSLVQTAREMASILHDYRIRHQGIHIV